MLVLVLVLVLVLLLTSGHATQALGCYNNLSNVMHGSYPKGVGWYRTSFQQPESAGKAGAASFLRFDGCLNDCMVFVNGKFTTRRFAAYSGFTVPLPAKPNELIHVLTDPCSEFLK